jgi:nickel-type superoxide dismutase maturation protease
MIGARASGRNSPCTEAATAVRRWWWVVVLSTLVMLVAQRSTRFVVEGESMFPSLRHGDYILATRLPHVAGAPRRGWVVVARRPDRPDLELIKRVAEPGKVRGSLMILGDNPHSSTDSRHFGPVLRDNLIGVAWLRYWPPPRFGPVR